MPSKKILVEMYQNTCGHCGHTWRSYVISKMCPNPHCKHRDWNDYTPDTGAGLEPIHTKAVDSITTGAQASGAPANNVPSALSHSQSNDTVPTAIPANPVPVVADVENVFAPKKVSAVDKFVQ